MNLWQRLGVFLVFPFVVAIIATVAAFFVGVALLVMLIGIICVWVTIPFNKQL